MTNYQYEVYTEGGVKFFRFDENTQLAWDRSGNRLVYESGNVALFDYIVDDVIEYFNMPEKTSKSLHFRPTPNHPRVDILISGRNDIVVEKATFELQKLICIVNYNYFSGRFKLDGQAAKTHNHA